MRNSNWFGKRGLALLLAGLTIMSTWGPSLTAMAEGEDPIPNEETELTPIIPDEGTPADPVEGDDDLDGQSLPVGYTVHVQDVLDGQVASNWDFDATALMETYGAVYIEDIAKEYEGYYFEDCSGDWAFSESEGYFVNFNGGTDANVVISYTSNSPFMTLDDTPSVSGELYPANDIVSQVVTAKTSDYSKINGFSLSVLSSTTSVSYSYEILTGLGDNSSYNSGNKTYGPFSGTADVTADEISNISVTVPAEANIVVPKGSYYSVRVTFGEGVSVVGTNAGFAYVGSAGVPYDLISVTEVTGSVNVTAIKGVPSSKTLIVGDAKNSSFVIDPVVEETNGFDVAASFSSSASGVASVSSDGTVTCGSTAGSADITVTAGAVSKKVTVNVIKISDTGSGYVYTGSEVYPSITVEDAAGAVILNGNNKTQVSSDADLGTYELEIGSSKNAGTNTYIIRNNTLDIAYQGTYVIGPKEIAAADFTGAKFVFDSSDKITDITGCALSMDNLEFDSIRKSINASAGTITYTFNITGKANYTGSINNFTYTKSGSSTDQLDISELFDLSLSEGSYPYNGAAGVSVPAGNLIFKLKGTDTVVDTFTSYSSDFAYSNNVRVGDNTATVTVTGTGNYKGSLSASFSIEPASMRGAVIEFVKVGDTAYAYDDANKVPCYYYNGGSEVRPKIKVTQTSGGSTVTLVEGEDYSIKYTDADAINYDGLSTVKVIGKNNYTGSVSASFNIVGKFNEQMYVKIGNTSAVKVEGGVVNSNYAPTYTGSNIALPTVSVYMGSTSVFDKLTAGQHYEIVYNGFKDVNGAADEKSYFTIKGLGIYQGMEVKVYFNILPKSIETGSAHVNGSVVMPTYGNYATSLKSGDYSVTIGGNTLVENTDYTVTYENNVNAGRATIKFTGCGNYTGTLYGYYTINKLSLYSSNVAVTVDPTTMTYNGATRVPDTVTVTVTTQDGGTKTIPASEYDIRVENAVNVGTAKLIVSAKTGSTNLMAGTQASTTYTISRRAVANYQIEVGNAGPARKDAEDKYTTDYSFRYDGRTHMIGADDVRVSAVDASGNAMPLTGSGVDYRITNPSGSGTNVGNAYFTISFTGKNHSGATSVNVYYNILPRSLSDNAASIKVEATGTKTKTINGVDVTVPVLKVEDAGIKQLVGGKSVNKTLVEDVDYTIAVSDGTDATVAGENKVAEIHGKGNYDGIIGNIVYSFGKNLSDDDVTVQLRNPFTNDLYGASNSAGEIEVYFLGKSTTPTIELEYNGTLLTKDVDYQLVPASTNPGDIYSVNNAAVSYTIKGIGREFYGSTSLKYRIKRVPINSPTETTDGFRIEVVDGKGNVAAMSNEKLTLTYPYSGNSVALSNLGLKLNLYYKNNGTPVDSLSLSDLVVRDKDLATSNAVSAIPAKPGDNVVYISTRDGNYDITSYLPLNIKTEAGELDYAVLYGTNKRFGQPPAIQVSYVANGSAKPRVTVYGKDSSTTPLEINKDYKVEYGANDTVGAGTGTLTIKGMGDYAGSSDLVYSFDIVQVELTSSNVEVDGLDETVYFDGSAKTLSNLEVYYKAGNTEDDKILLTKGTDYDVAYENNINIGQATIKIKDKGNSEYHIANPIVKTFDIKANLNNALIYPEGGTLETGKVYVKLQSTLERHVKTKDVTGLVTGIYYYDVDSDGNITGTELSLNTKTGSANYSATTQEMRPYPGDETLVVTGKNMAAGTFVYTDAKVTAYARLSEITVRGISSEPYAYTGQAINPSYNVVYRFTTAEGIEGEQDLIAGNYVTGNIVNNVGPGTATLKLTSDGKYYRDSKDVDFAIKYDLNSASITINNSGNRNYYDYGETPVASDFHVSVAGVNLTQDTHYKIWFENIDKVGNGVAAVTISYISQDGKSTCANSFGTKTMHFTIKAQDISTIAENDVVLDPTTNTYTGFAIEPAVSVTFNGKALVKGKDFEVSYKNNVNAGEATATIRGINGYTGEKAVKFTIDQKDITEDMITVPDDYYNGDKPVTPPVTVGITTPNKGTKILTLKEDENSEGDYTVAYASNNAVGTATVTVTAAGPNLKGSASKKFVIAATDIGGTRITVDNAEAEYTGSYITVDKTTNFISLSTIDGYHLVEGQDYEMTIDGQPITNQIKDRGRYTIVLQGKNGFTGTSTVYFWVTPRSIKNNFRLQPAVIDIEAEGKIYKEGDSDTIPHKAYLNGSPVSLSLKLWDKGVGVSDPGYVMVQDVDYTVGVFNERAAAGVTYLEDGSIDLSSTPYIQISGVANSNYNNESDHSVIIPFTIGTDINTAKVTIDPKQMTYDGSAYVLHDAKVWIDANGDGVEDPREILIEDEDYTLAYDTNSVDAGEVAGNVTLTGMGAYYGVKTESFKIDAREVATDDLELTLDTSAGTGVYVGYNDDGSSYYYMIYGTLSKYEPRVIVKDKTLGNVVVDPSFYEVSYRNNKAVTEGGNKAWALVTMTKNYTITSGSGSAEIDFRILPRDISEESTTGAYKIKIAGYNAPYDYTDENGDLKSVRYWYTQDYNYDDGRSLGLISNKLIEVYYQEDRKLTYTTYQANPNDPDYAKRYDCTVEIEGGDATAGIHKITVRGVNGFTGSLTTYVSIKANLEDAQITCAPTQFYTGEDEIKVKPEKVVCGGVELYEGVDYVVSDWYAPKGYGIGKTVTATITSKSVCFGGSKSYSYTIDFDKNLLSVTAPSSELPYNGKHQVPAYEITTPSGDTLEPKSAKFWVKTGTEENPEWTAVDETKEVGTYRVQMAIEYGNESFNLNAMEYKIVPIDLTNSSVAQIIYPMENTFLGLTSRGVRRLVEPKVQVKVNGAYLVEGEDFEVTYDNNFYPTVKGNNPVTNFGMPNGGGTRTPATLTVTGKGNCVGSETREFEIIPSINYTVNVASKTDTSVVLTWEDDPAVTGYKVYVLLGAGSIEQAGEFDRTAGYTSSNNYTVKQLTPSTNYTFAVVSYYTEGNNTYCGTVAKTVSTTTEMAVPSATSADITVTSTSAGSVKVTWNAAKAGNIQGYRVLRSTSLDGTYKRVASVPVKSQSYVNSGLTSGTYYYKLQPYVFGVDENGNTVPISGESSEAFAVIVQ